MKGAEVNAALQIRTIFFANRTNFYSAQQHKKVVFWQLQHKSFATQKWERYCRANVFYLFIVELLCAIKNSKSVNILQLYVICVLMTESNNKMPYVSSSQYVGFYPN